MSQKLAHNVRNKARTDDIKIEKDINFSAMLLSQPILQGLTKHGFYKPSPIQLKAIPLGRFGFDLVVKAKSGTGKTAVFGIIALEMIDVLNKNIQALILAPTREIAVQIQQVILTIGEYIPGLKVEYFIGGISINEDIKKLKQCHIAVGAAGRIKSLIKSGKFRTESIRLFVLDEADKLLETSFKSDINYIYNKLPARKQIIASSATYPNDLEIFLSNYMTSPTVVSPVSDVPVLIGIKQFVSLVDSHLKTSEQTNIKTNELHRILKSIKFTQCIVFCNYQMRAESISDRLTNLGWPCDYLSAAKTQNARLEAVDSLKQFKCRILSTTDLTARGIDAANVDLVINFDVPLDSETYLHRMGRAGRYGSSGICVTLAAEGTEKVKFQTMLGQIGGALFSVLKLNKNEVIDVWKCNESNFEKLFGINEQLTKCDSEQICNTLKELSVRTDDNETPGDKQNILENIAGSILNKNDIDITDSVGSLLQHLNQEHNVSKQENKYIDTTTTLNMTKNESKDLKSIIENEICDPKIEENLFGINQFDKVEMKSKIDNSNCGILQDTVVKSTDLSEQIDVESILENIHIRDRTSETDAKSELGNLNPGSIIEMLLQGNLNKDKLKKSKSKKIKTHENLKLDIIFKPKDNDTTFNMQFNNEAILFQKNVTLNKNIALHNITKLVVEQDIVTEENIENMEMLLNILKHEDEGKELKPEHLQKLATCIGSSLAETPNLNKSYSKTENSVTYLECGTDNLNLEIDLSHIPKWETIREYEVIDSGGEICTCHQNIFTNAYSFALSKTEDQHWKNTFCKLHLYQDHVEGISMSTEEKVLITKDDFLKECEDYYDDEDENMEEHIFKECYDEEIDVDYYENEIDLGDVDDDYFGKENDNSLTEEFYDASGTLVEEEERIVTWDEDLFIKSYDYALNSEVRCDSTTFCDSVPEENEQETALQPCGYAAVHSYNHLQSNTRKRSQVSSSDSSQSNSIADNQSYQSYFDYYHEMLAQNAPYIYDVENFESFFENWQKGVFATRNYVQEDIYAKEKLANENPNTSEDT